MRTQEKVKSGKRKVNNSNEQRAMREWLMVNGGAGGRRRDDWGRMYLHDRPISRKMNYNGGMNHAGRPADPRIEDALEMLASQDSASHLEAVNILRQNGSNQALAHLIQLALTPRIGDLHRYDAELYPKIFEHLLIARRPILPGFIEYLHTDFEPEPRGSLWQVLSLYFNIAPVRVALQIALLIYGKRLKSGQ